jgi:hypothetical protein
MNDRVHGRARLRRSIKIVADLADGAVAIRGHDAEKSLEMKGIYLVEGEPKATPVVLFKGHAGASAAVLDINGIDALIDELVIARERMEDGN